MTDVNPDKPETQATPKPRGHAVGRPDLNNPAPGLRAAQQFGDSVFNQTPGINKTLDDSPVGDGYHQVFGKRGDLALQRGRAASTSTQSAQARNGSFKGV